MTLALWIRWLGWLAAETTALVAGAAMFHLWLRSPRAGRIVWRAALMAVALVILFSGHWMLDTLVTYTEQLFQMIPQLISQ